MGSLRASAAIEVAYHAFFVSEDGDIPAPAGGFGANGLVAVSGSSQAATIWTGIHTGSVDVAIELRGADPPVDAGDWSDIVEVSLRVPVGRIRVGTLMTGVPEELPDLTPQGPGSYRFRVYARNRDTDIDGVAFEPFEHYLIQVWPAPPAADGAIRLTDAYGAQCRSAG